jgi:predicted pyridoxine 5'-phosphate oxidase superfamily flavin-nucleotide-binding protein
MGVLTEQMKQTIERVRLGFVATVCADGTPNVSPKGTVCVLDDDHLMFADLNSPGTVANLRGNSGVEVNVVDPFVRKGFRFKGVGTVLDSGPEFERLVGVFAARGTPDAPRRIRAVVVIRVDRARPVISPAYDQTTDEAEVRARWVRHYLKDERGA